MVKQPQREPRVSPDDLQDPDKAMLALGKHASFVTKTRKGETPRPTTKEILKWSKQEKKQKRSQ